MIRAALVLVAVAACTPAIYRAPVRQANYYSINADGSRSTKYSRINQWSSYGTNALGAQSKVASAYEDAQHAAPPRNDVEIYNASLPPGITLEGGAFTIAPDAPFEAVGKFEIGYWTETAPREGEIEDDLRRLAAVTRGSTIIVEVRRVDHADDRVQHMAGIVLKARTPSTPAVSRARANARLIYEARGKGLPSEDEFADEVSAKLGYSPWQAAATTTLHAALLCRDGAFRATISVPGAAPKQLTGDTCKKLTDAAITVVAVQLGDSLQR